MKRNFEFWDAHALVPVANIRGVDNILIVGEEANEYKEALREYNNKIFCVRLKTENTQNDAYDKNFDLFLTVLKNGAWDLRTPGGEVIPHPVATKIIVLKSVWGLSAGTRWMMTLLEALSATIIKNLKTRRILSTGIVFSGVYANDVEFFTNCLNKFNSHLSVQHGFNFSAIPDIYIWKDKLAGENSDGLYRAIDFFYKRLNNTKTFIMW